MKHVHFALFLLSVTLMVGGCVSPPSVISNTPPPAHSNAIPSPSRTAAQHGVPPSNFPPTPPLTEDALVARPLTIPTIDPGTPCPVTTAPVREWKRFSAPMVGHGPIYLVGWIEGEIDFTYSAFVDLGQLGTWRGQKTKFARDNNISHKRAIVRGRQLDGQNVVRFAMGVDTGLVTELRGYGRKQQTIPRTTYIREPGCYAYQIDGEDFSYHIVFKATF